MDVIMDSNKAIAKKDITINDFPPKLRKLANTIIETIQIKTLKEYCELANVNYDSIRATIPRCKKKGLDFNVYMNNQYMKFLNDNKLDVSKSLVGGAINGTTTAQKLYFQLTGDLIEKQEHRHTHAVIVSSPLSSQIPQDILDKRKEQEEKDKEVIDVEVIE